MTELIEQFENEAELPATWSNGGMGGYTKEYTEWLEQCLVKNLTIPVVSKAKRAVCPNCDSEKVHISYHYKESLCTECDNKWYWGK